MNAEEKKLVPAEIEGGGRSWWFVCGECHGAIDYMAKDCPHCKQAISWEEWKVSEKVRK